MKGNRFFCPDISSSACCRLVYRQVRLILIFVFVVKQVLVIDTFLLDHMQLYHWLLNARIASHRCTSCPYRFGNLCDKVLTLTLVQPTHYSKFLDKLTFFFRDFFFFPRYSRVRHAFCSFTQTEVLYNKP